MADAHTMLLNNTFCCLCSNKMDLSNSFCHLHSSKMEDYNYFPVEVDKFYLHEHV